MASIVGVGWLFVVGVVVVVGKLQPGEPQLGARHGISLCGAWIWIQMSCGPATEMARRRCQRGSINLGGCGGEAGQCGGE